MRHAPCFILYVQVSTFGQRSIEGANQLRISMPKEGEITVSLHTLSCVSLGMSAVVNLPHTS